MHQMTQFDQAKTIPFISAAPTVSRESVNGLLVSGLPIPQSVRLEESVLDRILLAYRKYLQHGSAEAKSKHAEGDFSDGGHYVIPLCYNWRFTPESDDTVQLHIEFWLSTCPMPYISAGVPSPKAAKPEDVFDKWMQQRGKLQVQRLNQSKKAKDKPQILQVSQDENTRGDSLLNSDQTDADPEVAEIDQIWRERELGRALAQRQLKDEFKVPKGYRPMFIQEVMPLFDGYLKALQAELEVFFQKAYQDAVVNQTAPDYYGFHCNYIPAPHIKPTLSQ